MKILLMSHLVPYPPHGGSQQRNFNLLKGISKDNEVYLLTFTQKVLIPSENELKDSVTALKDYCRYIEVVKIPSDYSKIKWFLLLLFNLFSSIPYSVWRYRSKTMIDKMKQQLRENQFDLIHIDTIALAQYARLAPGREPKVLGHHNVESSLLARRSANEKNPLAKIYLFLQGRKLKRYEEKVILNFDVNITVSKLDKMEFMKRIPQGRFEVVPNGTDRNYFKPMSEATSEDLIFVGGLSWYPNKDAILYFCKEILPLIRRKFPRIRMHIIGRNPPREIQQIAINDKDIDLLGHVDDVRTHIAEASVYVVPIRVGGGTRLKILDAMAMGKAIVSTSVGAKGLDLEDGKNILIADEPEDFAKKTEQILTTPALRRRLEHNARETVEKKYSWEDMIPKLQRIYSDVVSSKKQYSRAQFS